VTVSFLPAFSLPYTHYSLVARSEAMRRRFVEKRSWEDAAPPLKDPNRIPAPSTLRRWCRSLDSSHSAFSRLCRAVQTVAQWLDHGELPVVGSLRLSWPTVYPNFFLAHPTILGWESGLRPSSLTLRGVWMPCARISNGSNTFLRVVWPWPLRR
jgi:hypothetical protein